MHKSFRGDIRLDTCRERKRESGKERVQNEVRLKKRKTKLNDFEEQLTK